MKYFIGTSEKFENCDVIKESSIEYALNYFKDKEYIQLDTETSGFDPYLNNVICWQIGDRQNQFVIENKDYPFENYKEFFENESKTFILQNAKFDLRFFFSKKVIIKNIYDTYLAERLLTLGKPAFIKKSLDALVKRYCNTDIINKDIRGQIHWRYLDNIVIDYAAKDVEFLEDIMKAQLKRLQNYDLLKNMSLQNRYCIVLAYCEYCGFKLDKTKWIKLYEETLQKLNKQVEILNNFIIKDFPKYVKPQLDLFRPLECNINWNSSDQVIPFLEDLGLDLWTIEDGERKKSCGSSVIVPQVNKHPIVKEYLKYKKYFKHCSTYGLNVTNQINSKSGRLHTQFTQIMNTGRLSSGGKDKALKIENINFQNIPADEEIRSCFIAEEGNTLIVADYSGQEQIVLANQSQDKNLIKFYNSGFVDMHSFIASHIFSCNMEDILTAKKKYDKGLELTDEEKLLLKYRQIAKAAGFAINYGGNGYTIAKNLSISEEEGDKVYKNYFETFPGLKEYFSKIKKLMWSRGYILYNNLDRFKLFIDLEWFNKRKERFTPEFWDEYRFHKENETDKFKNELSPLVREYYRKVSSAERLAMNYPIQGTSASITKVAGLLFYLELVKRNLLFTVKICNFVHDEIVVECPINLKEEIANLLKTSMEKAGDYYCKIIPLKATPKITPYWKH